MHSEKTSRESFSEEGTFGQRAERGLCKNASGFYWCELVGVPACSSQAGVGFMEVCYRIFRLEFFLQARAAGQPEVLSMIVNVYFRFV